MTRFLPRIFSRRRSPCRPGTTKQRAARRPHGADCQRRMDAEHRHAILRCVIHNSCDGIAAVNCDGVVEICNPAAEAILGRRAEEVCGMPIHSFIPWTRAIEQLYEDAAADDAELSASRTVGPVELTVSRADGVERIIELQVTRSKLCGTVAPAAGNGADRIMHIYSFRDITERKRAEDAQRKAIAQVAAASRAKSEFLANMSHELRTPLNAVIGFSEVMKSQSFGPIGVPEYAEYVEDIYESGQHLLSVINDILDLSRIEAGEMRLTEAMVDIGGLVRSCGRLISERARKGKVGLSVEVPDGLPWLRADERLVKQMVLNLLTNAVKFTPKGGRVSVRTEFDAVGCLVITVADTGIGIAPEDMDKVLRPFGQAGVSQEPEQEGTGLGLPLVKAMAELHGALLVIDSTVNVGTTAAIRFPVARVQPRAEPAAA